MERESSGALLVVDDDFDTLEVLPSALRPLGAVVTAASSGEQAVRLVSDHDYAAIVLDVNMGAMDGFEAARQIRQLERSRRTPIIFVTGESIGEPARRTGYQVGGVDYLSKPVELDVLLAKLRVFLDFDLALRQIHHRNTTLTKQVAEHAEALANVRTLKGLIPICAYCHQIRDDHQSWQALESYITERTEASFSHGICPGCYESRVSDDLRRAKLEPPQ